MSKPTVALDFDGVVHSYTSGWKGADVIPDPPTEGAREAIAELRETYRVVIFSTRAARDSSRPDENDEPGTLPIGLTAIYEWLQRHGIRVDGVSAEKPKAILYVDDRAFRFAGRWDDVARALAAGPDGVEPWNRKPAPRMEAETPALIDWLQRMAPPPDPEALARLFHEAYERLAPAHGYETRKASAVPWDQVPTNNKALMIAVCSEITAAIETACPHETRLSRFEAMMMAIETGDPTGALTENDRARVAAILSGTKKEVGRDAAL